MRINTTYANSISWLPNQEAEMLAAVTVPVHDKNTGEFLKTVHAATTIANGSHVWIKDYRTGGNKLSTYKVANI